LIVVYAGRRPSDTGPLTAAALAVVDKQLRLLFAGLRPRLVFGSAAAGSDLLVLRAAKQAGAAARVYIAGDRSAFRRVSVEDKGGDWPALFDALTASESARVTEVGAADAQGFSAVTARMLSDALLALSEGEPLVVVIVSEGRRAGADETEDLATSAEAEGHLVLRVAPQARGEERRAFVAMPYGVRRVGGGAPDWDADATYYRIVAPALISSGYSPLRADLEASLEIIDTKMIREMGAAPLFVADLALQNPNVLWELGVRHAWVPAGTVLVKPEGSDRPPFDVARVPVVPYRRAADSVPDSDLVWSLRQLLPVLQAPRNGYDSPVFLALPKLAAPDIAAYPVSGTESDRAAEWARRLQLAVVLREADVLREVLEEARAVGDESTATTVGLAAIQLGLFELAAELLQPTVEADLDFSLVLLQQQYSLALAKTRTADNVRKAELRLAALDARQPGSAETLGLLGSVAKVGFQIALDADEPANAHLDRAISAYVQGAQADPGDYFPAINAILLLRVRAAQTGGPHSEQDLAMARELVHIVRFALARPQVQEGVWAEATRGELAVHDHLLGGPSTLQEAHARYSQAAARATHFQLQSMRAQLELCLRLGDPDTVIAPLLALLR
jgi:hypothetical protein